MSDATTVDLQSQHGEHGFAERAVPLLPFLLLCAFLLVLILRPSDFVPALASVPLALITFLAMLAAWLCSGQSTVILPHATNKFAVALLAVMVLVTPFSYWPGMSVMATLDYLKTVCLMILIVNLVTNVDAVAGVLWIFVAAHAPHAVMIVRAYLSGRLVRGRAFGAAGSVFEDPNDLALSFVIVLPLTLWLLSRSRHASARLLCLALLLLFVAGVIASQSRGGLVGLVATVVLMVWNCRHGVLAAAVAVLLGIVIAAANPAQIWERVYTIKTYRSDESAQSRLFVWGTGLRMWADHPLTGVGCGAFPIAYGREYLNPTAPTRTWLQAHNSAIEAVVELGVFGLAAWVGMVAAGFAALRGARRLLAQCAAADLRALQMTQLCTALRSALIGYIICAMFLTRAYDWLLMILLALGVCCWRMVSTPRSYQAGECGEGDPECYANGWPLPAPLRARP